MLWKVFTKNPFSSLKQHMQKTMECADKTLPLFEALFSGDTKKVDSLVKEISCLEHDCDIIKQEIHPLLTKSIFLPVERRDLLHVLNEMDKIANYAEDIGVLLSLRKNWSLPVELQPLFNNLLARSLKVVHRSAEVIDAFDQLLEAGFAGPDVDAVMRQISNTDRLEHEADKAQTIFGKELFNHEDEMKPLEVFMWTKISNKVGDLANSAENMVNYVRLMLAP